VIRGNAVGEMLRGLGHRRFVHKFYQLLGLEDANERRCYSAEKGRCVLEGATISPGEVSVLDLAMGLTGTSGSALEELLRTPAHRRVDVMEAGTEIVPSAFANISAFNASVAGLLEARLLEAYSRPAYIAEQLGEVIPSTKRSEKFIGISTVGDASLERKPGDPHVRAAGGEQYVTTPETKNRGIAIEVTREAVMFDLTRDLLAQAEKAADALALRKEYLMVDCVLGVTNTYNYNGTSYNTYQTATPWINNIQNPLVNWTDYDEALQLFAGMTDPETGEPIEVRPNAVLAMPAEWVNHSYYLNSAEVGRYTSSLAEEARGRNPMYGMFQLLGGPTYPYAYKRARAADGLNLSEANAKGLWLLGDFKGAFAWVQNLPLTVLRANPSDHEMADRGLVFALFADEMGTAAVKDPRKVVKNRVEA